MPKFNSEGMKDKFKIFYEDYKPEETKFSTGKVKKPNMGKTISLDSVAKDQKSFTGKNQGFFAKFGSNKVS